MSRLDLQKLTLLLALVAGLLTFANSFFAGYSSQRDQLFDPDTGGQPGLCPQTGRHDRSVLREQPP
nr:hypothetical protein [Stutzerimonas stutzeri]